MVCRVGAAWLVIALLASCTSAPVASSVQVRADVANRKGLDQLRTGNAEAARAAFETALRLEQSIEHEAGIARAWYNLSVAYQRLGQHAEAERALDAVLLDEVHTFPEARLAEVYFRKAVLAIASRNIAAATPALERTRELCRSTCTLLGPLLNLEARLALEEARFDDALSLLAEATPRTSSNPIEHANTLRLRASALLALGRMRDAEVVAGAALDTDKKLGRSDKIYQDLILLARASADRPRESRSFLLRAADVARASGDDKGIKEARELLERVDNQVSHGPRVKP